MLAVGYSGLLASWVINAPPPLQVLCAQYTSRQTPRFLAFPMLMQLGALDAPSCCDALWCILLPPHLASPPPSPYIRARPSPAHAPKALAVVCTNAPLKWVPRACSTGVLRCDCKPLGGWQQSRAAPIFHATSGVQQRRPCTLRVPPKR